LLRSSRKRDFNAISAGDRPFDPIQALKSRIRTVLLDFRPLDTTVILVKPVTRPIRSTEGCQATRDGLVEALGGDFSSMLDALDVATDNSASPKRHA
jgi:hypothetical protein